MKGHAHQAPRFALADWFTFAPVPAGKAPMSAGGVRALVERVTAAVNAEIDVAWDVLHDAGWQPEHIVMHVILGTQERRQLVIKRGAWSTEDVPVFEVEMSFVELGVHVTPRWLASVPRRP